MTSRPVLLPYLLLLPALLLEVGIHLVPAVSGILMGFRSSGPASIADPAAAPWVGWANFGQVLSASGPLGDDFRTTAIRSLLFTVLVVGCSWLLGVVAAVLLAGSRRRGFFRVFFLLPFALPAYASVLGWRLMFARDNGLVNHLLVDQTGLLTDRPFWLIGDNAFAAMVIVAVWRLWPFIFLMLLAALQSVDAEQYEAAAIDGASWLQQQWTVTRPAIGRFNLIVLAVAVLWTFSDFSTPHLLFAGSPPPAALLLPNLIYANAFGLFDLGVAAAANTIVLVVLFVACGVVLVFRRRSVRHA